MKKVMFFAMATVALFASCSSDESLEAGQGVEGGQQGIENRMPIMVNLGQAISAETKGYGTIGRDSSDAAHAITNKWYAEQAFNLYMFKKDTLELAMEGNTAIFDNQLFKISADQTGDSVAAWPVDLQQRYYPQNGAYDFWAYRLDDAGTAAPQLHTTGTKADSMTVAFKIDGSQDLMIAKADTLPTIDKKYLFSAFSARRGYQPNLKFSHLLTRLHFTVQPGEDLTANPIVVDSIIVLSKADGHVVIAYAPEFKDKYVTRNAADTGDSIINRIKFDAAVAADSMILMEYPDLTDPTIATTNPEHKLVINEELATLNGPATTTPVRVGEALLVAPGETEYELIVKYKQTVPTTVNAAVPNAPKYFVDNTSKIKLTSGDAFQPGTSYKVNIKFYGAQPIQVSASLVDWVNGEDIDIDPDENWTE